MAERKYNGVLGGVITTTVQLEALAKAERSIACVRGACVLWVLPASSLKNRTYRDVLNMLNSGELRDYTKPERKPVRLHWPRNAYNSATVTQQRNAAMKVAEDAVGLIQDIYLKTLTPEQQFLCNAAVINIGQKMLRVKYGEIDKI